MEYRGGINLYAYANNQPTNAIDPLGLAEAYIQIGGGVTGGLGIGGNIGIVITTNNKFGVPDIGIFVSPSMQTGWSTPGATAQVGFDTRPYSGFQGQSLSVDTTAGCGAGAVTIDPGTHQVVGGSWGAATPGVGATTGSSYAVTFSLGENIVNPILQSIYGGSVEEPPATLGSAWGDVHLTAYDGLAYNFQAAGEFVLTQSTQPGNSFQIQTRLEPWGSSSSVSVMTMIGAEVGTDRVTFGLNRDNTVMVDGAAAPALGIGSPVTLSGGTLSQLAPNIYQIDWNTGENGDHYQGRVVLQHQRWARRQRWAWLGPGPARARRRPSLRLPARQRNGAAAAAHHGSGVWRVRQRLAGNAGKLAP